MTTPPGALLPSGRDPDIFEYSNTAVLLLSMEKEARTIPHHGVRPDQG